MSEFVGLDEISFENIPVDEYWNVGDQKEELIHKIHNYPAKFPAFITTKAIEYAKSLDINPRKIADIFCGCGTVAIEAKKNNIAFWGCDINPVATLIAKVKSGDYDIILLNEYRNSILSKFQKADFLFDYSQANERIKYWFYDETFQKLSNLKKVIIEENFINDKYRQFFLCAFSNILKPSSKWLTKSIKPQIDPSKSQKNVFDLFKKQTEMMISAYEQSGICKKGKITIETTNFLKQQLKRPKVDMIVTSPPYVTSYEYADLHQLSSLWLDFTQDYRELRQGSIGSIYHSEKFKIEDFKLNEIAQDTISSLCEKIETSKLKSIARYFSDMQKVSKLAFNMLNDRGLALFVIGNTEYKGIKIDNARHLAFSLKNAGFTKFHITKRNITSKFLTPYRDNVGKFTNNKECRKVYAEEFIVIGEKTCK